MEILMFFFLIFGIERASAGELAYMINMTTESKTCVPTKSDIDRLLVENARHRIDTIPAHMIAPRHIGTWIFIVDPQSSKYIVASASKELCERSAQFFSEIKSAIDKIYDEKPRNLPDYWKRFGKDGRKPASSGWFK